VVGLLLLLLLLLLRLLLLATHPNRGFDRCSCLIGGAWLLLPLLLRQVTVLAAGLLLLRRGARHSSGRHRRCRLLGKLFDRAQHWPQVLPCIRGSGGHASALNV
jgi:hypothetical protein